MSTSTEYARHGRLTERFDAGLVNAAVVRTHLRELARDGILHEYVHLHNIGVSAEEVAAIVGGARDTNRDVAKAILSLRADTPFPSRAAVAATGAKRRIQALVVHGWTLGQVAGWLGVHQSVLSGVLHDRTTHVSANLHVRIARMYREREMQTPSSKSAWSVGRSRRDGWKGGLAWNDIDRDDDIAHSARPRPVYT